MKFTRTAESVLTLHQSLRYEKTDATRGWLLPTQIQ